MPSGRKARDEQTGKMIQRTGTCPICGKEFLQSLIAPAFIDALTPEQRVGFLATCVVEDGNTYQPPICKFCSRPSPR